MFLHCAVLRNDIANLKVKYLKMLKIDISVSVDIISFVIIFLIDIF